MGLTPRGRAALLLAALLLLAVLVPAVLAYQARVGVLEHRVDQLETDVSLMRE